MTVKRQYTLPYCQLILEGLTASGNDSHSPLTVLMNVECYLPGTTQGSLSGGREFLDSLVAAVSRYGQQLLSGVTVPAKAAPTEPPWVDLKSGPDSCHHLLVRSQPLDHSPLVSPEDLIPVDIPLSTVQFHDLMEAVDQLLADTQTLPDLTAQFQALPRRLVKPSIAFSQQALPATLGAVALAAAGLAFFFIPPPQIKPAKSSQRQSPALVSTASGQPPALAAASSPAITAPEQLALLQRDLTQRLQSNWKPHPAPSQNLVYRLSVAADGDIVAYKYTTHQALQEVDRTPLPQLSFDPVATANPSQEPTAQFRATFTPTAAVRVEPWSAAGTLTPVAKAELPEITSPLKAGDRIRQLNAGLYDQLLARAKPLSTSEPLTYRVRLNQTGIIVAYQPVTATAGLLARETPLPALAAAPDQASSDPQADFKVVFTATGVPQVNPWDGWP
ncbi:MAG: DUF4335 domain-containing protein [Cyanobacteria bacterium REEB459]|nr:DUF4335 domain-containing protein [Cyanobacteria bacterium REEB459]